MQVAVSSFEILIYLLSRAMACVPLPSVPPYGCPWCADHLHEMLCISGGLAWRSRMGKLASHIVYHRLCSSQSKVEKVVVFQDHFWVWEEAKNCSRSGVQTLLQCTQYLRRVADATHGVGRAVMKMPVIIVRPSTAIALSSFQPHEHIHEAFGSKDNIARYFDWQVEICINSTTNTRSSFRGMDLCWCASSGVRQRLWTLRGFARNWSCTSWCVPISSPSYNSQFVTVGRPPALSETPCIICLYTQLIGIHFKLCRLCSSPSPSSCQKRRGTRYGVSVSSDETRSRRTWCNDIRARTRILMVLYLEISMVLMRRVKTVHLLLNAVSSKGAPISITQPNLVLPSYGNGG